jgi:chemotaxis protein MotB
MSKHKEKIEKDTAERWLLTYADLMNLLLIFFIVLYSMSLTDKAKFDALAQSLKQAFGTSTVNKFFSPGAGNTPLQNTRIRPPSQNNSTEKSKKEAQAAEKTQLEKTQKTVEQIIKKDGLNNSVNVSIEERGVKISITSQVLFLSGSAQIESSGYQILQKIGGNLSSFSENSIRIEGHTDTDPISTALFPSNWELSSARATNVLRFLIERTNLKAENLSAVGYGEYHPLLPNTTEENKAKNRRVDIVILKQDASKSEPDK